MSPLGAGVALLVLPALWACHSGAVSPEAPGPGTERVEPTTGDARAAETATSEPAEDPTDHVRVNQLGYLPEGPKVAVVCSLEPARIADFTVVDGEREVAFGPAPATAEPGFGPCVTTHRLDFSGLEEEGEFTIVAGDARPVRVRVARDAYAGAADAVLAYLRQQRSGFNPLFGDSVHTEDGILVDHPRAGERLPVSGGWHDAADYLQYVATSAHATYGMLAAARDHPDALGDRHDARGLPGPNGVADVLDEARHGLDWLVRMYPEDDLLLNQIADDRDHTVWALPTTDTVDYGWGAGGPRPVYPCTGEPQGLGEHRNRSDGLASTAGKFASAMGLGARLLGEREPAFADTLARKARAAYELGREHPGVCQTAPMRAPYFYEEESWVDDMELAAAQLHALTGEERYLAEALEYAGAEPVSPWMGRDTARHYEFYPFVNHGHYEVWREGAPGERERMEGYYREGMEAVAARADHGFRVGIPFIWCSNNLMAAFATQAWLYRRMSGDERYREYETAAFDWLFGTNPWGMSMVIGLPEGGRTPRNPHSIVAREIGPETQAGGLVDGPVYRTIFESLLHVSLEEEDRFADFNTGRVVYHDDFGDYSTNEPTMDGSAGLVYLLAAMAGSR